MSNQKRFCASCAHEEVQLGNVFHFTGPLWEESISNRLIPSPFIYSKPEQPVTNSLIGGDFRRLNAYVTSR